MPKHGPTKFATERPQVNDPRIINGNLMDGEGPPLVRAHKLMKLQRLGVVDKSWDFPKLLEQPAAFDLMESKAIDQAREKSVGKGFLLAHTRGTNPGYMETVYEGDPEVAWGQFKHRGFVAKINTEVGTREVTTKIRDGDTLVVLRPDGTIAHLDGRVIENANEKTTGGSEASNKGRSNPTPDELMKDPEYQRILAKKYRDDIEKKNNQTRSGIHHFQVEILNSHIN
ncbi:hypothetical protein [Dyella caseinilytica]|uniref:Uncharacterized protein n=1 Tax=Dyella caseinilytica TaxID=1849581 RepID=A0ABX7GY20_9GAMM|nr:hypothetical protein [Dyella caseinilytica]QRN55387.1 hypothetical protein ISN74_08720 [Dyella caseinilytica]GGA01328.1 hypothetical protein GCM10011408_23250 [Dyella caseinilytica]